MSTTHNHAHKDHTHNHSHGYHHHQAKGKRLALTIFLNLLITAAQIIGGLLSGSLSLLSDAAHNFSDVLALIISWIADRLSKKTFTAKQTFGYKRAEVLAAFINVVTIIVIAINIFIEGIERIISPEPVTGSLVMLLAGLSILLNGLSVLIIKGDAEHSMNMKSAYLHLFSDMLTSIAVLLGGVMMYFFNIFWIDGVIAIIIAVYLIKVSLSLLFDTLKVLMQFTPDAMDLDSIKDKLETFEFIDNLHHIHIWRLVDNDIHFEAHVDFNQDYTLSVVDDYIKSIKKVLKEDFGITHSTLESEFKKCKDKHMIENC
jgi:cobalt-zinc-cadmium efflux system protein